MDICRSFGEWLEMPPWNSKIARPGSSSPFSPFLDRFYVTVVRWLFRNTFNNVACGIALMVLIGGYIAIGSGFASVREYFEMNELEFFDAWPLKVLMLLLCLNLATVTFNRIPFTPPRFGVWCIHAGIILLICGTSLYYHFKVEGRTMIPLNHTVNIFYDSAERALYARVMNSDIYGIHDLPSLPRFGEYDADHYPDRLDRADLQNISHLGAIANSADGAPTELSQWLGLEDPVTLNFVGYYSYADIVQNVVPDPPSDSVGVEVKLESPQADSPGALLRLTATDPTSSHQFFGNDEFEFRQVSEGSLAEITNEAAALFQLRVALPGQDPATVSAGMGTPVILPGGYTVTVESYNPVFPMFGTHEQVQALTLHISSDSPKREFRRMILAGRDLQTDFLIDPHPAPNSPPMGKRQKTPIDKSLVLNFRINDPSALMPTASAEKHVFLATGDHTLTDIHTSFAAPTEILDLTPGGQIDVPTDTADMTGLVRRIDHFRLVSSVVATPDERRIKDQAEAGIRQVAVVRVTCGKWSDDICVPCDPDAAPDPQLGGPMIPWNMGVVQIPGAKGALQLQLGYLCRSLPAAVGLRNFELVHYPGGQGPNGPFRDFRSTLEITGVDGQSQVSVASLNEPVYFQGGKWIFFQAGYDPDGQFSTIGIGNRPGVYIMVTGCGMIVLGLIYAFHAKPIVIRKMRAKALARAAAAKVLREPTLENVGVS